MTARNAWRPHISWRWISSGSLSASAFVRLTTPIVTARIEAPRPFVRVPT